MNSVELFELIIFRGKFYHKANSSRIGTGTSEMVEVECSEQKVSLTCPIRKDFWDNWTVNVQSEWVMCKKEKVKKIKKNVQLPSQRIAEFGSSEFLCIHPFLTG